MAKVADENVTMALTGDELSFLLGSPGLEQKLRRKEVTERLIV